MCQCLHLSVNKRPTLKPAHTHTICIFAGCNGNGVRWKAHDRQMTLWIYTRNVKYIHCIFAGCDALRWKAHEWHITLCFVVCDSTDHTLFCFMWLNNMTENTLFCYIFLYREHSVLLYVTQQRTLSSFICWSTENTVFCYMWLNNMTENTLFCYMLLNFHPIECITWNVSTWMFHTECFTWNVSTWMFHTECITWNVSTWMFHTECITWNVSTWMFHTECFTRNVSPAQFHVHTASAINMDGTQFLYVTQLS